MSTRSEIRFYVGKKQEACVYHHSDGYPEHIVEDLVMIGHRGNFKELMTELSRSHGTQDPSCSSGNKGKKYQGDIEYSYEVYLKKDKGPPSFFEVEKVKIYSHDDFDNINNKKLIFDGTVSNAYKKYACKEITDWCNK